MSTCPTLCARVRRAMARQTDLGPRLHGLYAIYVSRGSWPTRLRNHFDLLDPEPIRSM
jgi:hypothetical protein